jgi:predicted nucleic acid-binding protein
MAGESAVYWDSSAFLSRFARAAGRVEALEEVTDAAERGEIQIVTSILTMAEVAWWDGDDAKTPEQEEKLVAFFENPYITVQPLDYFVAEHARRLIREHKKLHGADAVHLATAVRHGVSTVHAYDTDMLNLNGKIGGLAVEEPVCQQGKLNMD